MKTLQAHFSAIEAIVYKQLSTVCTTIVQESESQEYGACSFFIKNYSVRFRVAKITPTKTGQFVTFWKRISSGPIMPYDEADSIDFLLVSVHRGTNHGCFIFPRTALIDHTIISSFGKAGKRAFRVYPSWDIVDSKQAQATQAWQLQYFIAIQLDGSCDRPLLKKLLQITV